MDQIVVHLLVIDMVDPTAVAERMNTVADVLGGFVDRLHAAGVDGREYHLTPGIGLVEYSLYPRHGFAVSQWSNILLDALDTVERIGNVVIIVVIVDAEKTTPTRFITALAQGTLDCYQ